MRRTRGRHSLPKQNKGHLARTIQVAAMAAIISLLSAGVAFADNVQNDVVAGGNDTNQRWRLDNGELPDRWYQLAGW
jgi:hypothetical protein